MFLKKLIAYPLSIIYYISFLIIILILHPIQWLAFTFFGYTAHNNTVNLLNFLITYNLLFLGCKPCFYGFKNLPKNRPFIIVSNHQSMNDISPLAWGFRNNHVKFIAKKELGKSLPSVSYNLKKGGSVLIDRKNGLQSIKEIIKLGRFMEQKNVSACIFPEGTRSITGKVKHFQAAGFKSLLKASPSALIVPFVIHNNYLLHENGRMFPLNIGLKLRYTALPPMERDGYTDEELLQLVENKIKDTLGQCG